MQYEMTAPWSTAGACRLIFWLLASAVIVRAAQTSRSRDSCPTGWLGPHRNTCYKMSDSAETWHTANETGCRALDTRAHLAAITYDNNAFLSKQVELFTPDFYWVGLRSSDDEWNKGTEYATKVEDGSFTWASLGYSNPSHAGDPEWDCVIADAEGWKDGEWCSSKFASLCQLDQGSDCPDGWEALEGSCFRVNTKRLSWEEAKEACSTLHDDARLATPEFDLSKSTLMEDAKRFWIALRSTRDENGRFRWSDKNSTVVTHTFWAEFWVLQAPLRAGTDDDCVKMIGMIPYTTFTTGELIDGGCDRDELPFLCELQLE